MKHRFRTRSLRGSHGPVQCGDNFPNPRRSYVDTHSTNVDKICRCHVSLRYPRRYFQCSRNICTTHLTHYMIAEFSCYKNIATSYFRNISYLGASCVVLLPDILRCNGPQKPDCLFNEFVIS